MLQCEKFPRSSASDWHISSEELWQAHGRNIHLSRWFAAIYSRSQVNQGLRLAKSITYTCRTTELRTGHRSHHRPKNDCLPKTTSQRSSLRENCPRRLSKDDSPRRFCESHQSRVTIPRCLRLVGPDIQLPKIQLHFFWGTGPAIDCKLVEGNIVHITITSRS